MLYEHCPSHASDPLDICVQLAPPSVVLQNDGPLANSAYTTLLSLGETATSVRPVLPLGSPEAVCSVQVTALSVDL